MRQYLENDMPYSISSVNIQIRRIRKLGPGLTIRVDFLSTHHRRTLC